jgi:hypothetical protein
MGLRADHVFHRRNEFLRQTAVRDEDYANHVFVLSCTV